MNTKMLRLLLIAVLALCMGTVVAACGDDDESGSSGGEAALWHFYVLQKESGPEAAAA